MIFLHLVKQVILSGVSYVHGYAVLETHAYQPQLHRESRRRNKHPLFENRFPDQNQIQLKSHSTPDRLTPHKSAFTNWIITYIHLYRAQHSTGRQSWLYRALSQAVHLRSPVDTEGRFQHTSGSRNRAKNIYFKYLIITKEYLLNTPKKISK